MDRRELYDCIAARKDKPADYEPYGGGNGRVDRCARLFRSGKLKPGGTLVDVGGGIGDLCSSMVDLFQRRVVVDISERALGAALAKGHETRLCDVDREALPFDNASVDVVTALDLIEHVVDPEQFARECFRVLRPSGVVFINTPNIRFWKHVWQLLIDGRFPHTSGDHDVYHGGHLAFYTRRDLCDIFSKFGAFKMHHDDDGFCPPPDFVTRLIPTPQTRDEYILLMEELGCPNLLFSCVKP